MWKSKMRKILWDELQGPLMINHFLRWEPCCIRFWIKLTWLIISGWTSVLLPSSGQNRELHFFYSKHFIDLNNLLTFTQSQPSVVVASLLRLKLFLLLLSAPHIRGRQSRYLILWSAHLIGYRFFTPNALPDAILPIYPGLGPALSMH